MDLHRLRQSGAPVAALVDINGHDAVAEELFDMCFDDIADLALAAAVQIGETRVARTAANIVLNTGSYLQQARDQARAFLNRQ